MQFRDKFQVLFYICSITTFLILGSVQIAYAQEQDQAVGVVTQSIAACDGVSQMPQIECEALVALYESANGSGWTSNNGWVETNTPCNWSGVTCEAGRVSKLALAGNQLNGTIPPELSNLTALQELYLSNNRLSGQIPPELGNLTALQIFFFTDNRISGQIPAEVGNLAALQVLSAGANQLSGQIPAELGNLTALRELWLDNNQLSGELPPALGNLSELRELHLHNNKLSGQIPAEISNLAAIEVLWLDNNQLSGQIPSELGNLDTLKSLSLHHNELSGELPARLSNLSVLAALYVNDNPLGGPLPLTFMNLSRLNKFEFDQTQICEPNVLQSWLAEIPSLERTNTPCLSTVAECNNVSQIPQIECETLVTFYKNTNGAEWLDNTGWLQTNTPCSWFGVRCASIHVGQIRLVNNQLSGAIPAELSNLPKLQTLVLPENQLSGQIPAELGDLATLNILALHENQLSGQIPAELGNLIRLKSIHLHENQLSGQIPATLYNLPVLEKLYLHNNQMSGQIPAEISNLTALETLALHKNQFSGPIPTEIGNLTTLEILALHENQMSGQVPAEIGNLTRLRELYLHDNQFSGAFPAEISNLSSLSTFSIGGNQLTNGVVEIDTISEGDGTIERTIDAPFYAGGTSIELTAVPAEGWRFVRWIGPQISADLATQPTITIIAGQENETFTAYFAANTESEVAGDVNCNGILEIEDALFILQHHLEQRESSDCPLAGPNTLNVALGDVDNSDATDATDALAIFECMKDQQNDLCPEVRGVNLTAIELVIAKEVEQLLKDEGLLKEEDMLIEQDVEIFLPVLLR